jgi:hypothetical protein
MSYSELSMMGVSVVAISILRFKCWATPKVAIRGYLREATHGCLPHQTVYTVITSLQFRSSPSNTSLSAI